MKNKIIKSSIFLFLFCMSVPNLVFAKYIIITCESPQTSLHIKDLYFSDPKFNTLIFINKGLEWEYTGNAIKHEYTTNSLSAVVYDKRGYMVGYNIPDLSSQPANQLKGTSIFQVMKNNAPFVNETVPTDIICSMQIVNHNENESQFGS